MAFSTNKTFVVLDKCVIAGGVVAYCPTTKTQEMTKFKSCYITNESSIIGANVSSRVVSTYNSNGVVFDDCTIVLAAGPYAEISKAIIRNSTLIQTAGTESMITDGSTSWYAVGAKFTGVTFIEDIANLPATGYYIAIDNSTEAYGYNNLVSKNDKLKWKAATTTAGGFTGLYSTSPMSYLEIFNTQDHVTNYEKFRIAYNNNNLVMSSEAAGTGTPRDIIFQNPISSYSLLYSASVKQKMTMNSGAPNVTGLAVDYTGTNTTGYSRPMAIRPIYNQGTSAASATDLTIDRNEIAVGTGKQSFIEFKVGGNVRYSIENNGATFIANTATEPAKPTGGGVFYVQSGALKYKGSNGTVTTIGAA